MKPITYYVQNAQINTLVQEFGDNLQELSLPDCLILRLALTQYVAGRWLLDLEYSMGRALYDCLIVDDEGDYCYNDLSDWLPKAFEILDGITADEADALVVAVTDRIREIGPSFRQQSV